jgi:hypothetical protein
LIVRVAPSENAIQRPWLDLTPDEAEKIETALRHIKHRIRKWEKNENPSEYESRREKKRRRRKHDSGSDYSSEEEREREKKRRRKKRRSEEELDEEFFTVCKNSN